MFIQSSTYAQQAKGLELHSPYELDILTNADFSIKMRGLAKIGTIIGSVASAVSPIFSYDPTISLVVTSVSAIAWVGSHKLAQTLEPQAQKMIRELQERTPNQANLTRFSIGSRQNFQDSKKRMLEQLSSKQSSGSRII